MFQLYQTTILKIVTKRDPNNSAHIWAWDTLIANLHLPHGRRPSYG